MDAELVRRGLAVSRAEAREAIQAGLVTVGGRPAPKAAMLVSADEPVRLDAPARRFVSRGGEKLAAALDRFAIDPSGRQCLDAGASTGGFTDCLLQRGAARVAAVDVGYGQLAWSLRNDERVEVLERTNARELRPEDLAFVPDLIVADLSFISLRAVLGALFRVAGPSAEFVLLVKPQFEAGRQSIGKGGVVRDPDAWRRAVEHVAVECRRLGFVPLGVMASPITGPAGNVEFLLHVARQGGPVVLDVDAAIEEGTAVRKGS